MASRLLFDITAPKFLALPTCYAGSFRTHQAGYEGLYVALKALSESAWHSWTHISRCFPYYLTRPLLLVPTNLMRTVVRHSIVPK